MESVLSADERYFELPGALSDPCIVDCKGPEKDKNICKLHWQRFNINQKAGKNLKWSDPDPKDFFVFLFLHCRHDNLKHTVQSSF